MVKEAVVVQGPYNTEHYVKVLETVRNDLREMGLI
jgi:hypothetical protein